MKTKIDFDFINICKIIFWSFVDKTTNKRLFATYLIKKEDGRFSKTKVYF